MERKAVHILTVNNAMTSQQILHADFLDIVFEKRNKTYGAYQLRKLYPRQLTKALLFSLTPVFLFCLLFQPSGEQQNLQPFYEGIIVSAVEALPPEKKPEPVTAPPAANRPVKQQAFIDKIVIVEKDIPTTLPPVDALEIAAVSNVTTDGEAVGAMQPSLAPAKAEAESLPTTSDEAMPKEVVPDKQPQFPGGMQAWTAFLNRYLQSPQDLEPGEKRTVQIRFHVAEDGRVTAFQVVQSAGVAFDNEVIRVLKKMPSWTPATKNGKPLPVSFTQPVTFVGMEE